MTYENIKISNAVDSHVVFAFIDNLTSHITVTWVHQYENHTREI